MGHMRRIVAPQGCPGMLLCGKKMRDRTKMAKFGRKNHRQNIVFSDGYGEILRNNP